LVYVFIIFKFPYLTYDATVFDEHGRNFLYAAYNLSSWGNIWLDDSGYLTWAPRFIAIFTSSFANVYSFVYITNFIAFAFISYCLTFFNKRDFRSLIKSDFIRALITLVVPFFFYYEDLFFFNNFSYFFFFICTLIIFLDKEKIKNCDYFLYLFLCVVAIMSKGHFVILFPFFFIAAVYHCYRKQYRSVIFYLPLLLSVIASLFFYINSGFIARAHNENSIFEILAIALHSWVQIYAMYFNIFTPPRVTSFLGTVCAILLILFLLVYLIKKTKICFLEKGSISTDLVAVLTLNAIAVAYVTVNSVRHIPFSRLESYDIAFVFFPSSRVYFIAVIFVFISLCILFYKISNKKIRDVSLIIFLIYTAYVFLPYISHPENRSNIIEWKDVHSVMLENDSYCIPTNPIRRVIRSNCKSVAIKMAESKSFSTEELGLNDDKILSLLVEDNSNNNLYAVAYDKNNKEISRVKALGAPEKKYKYVVFNQPTKFKKLIFFNNDNEDSIVNIVQLHIHRIGSNSQPTLKWQTKLKWFSKN
jgi:hypothetical protein